MAEHSKKHAEKVESRGGDGGFIGRYAGRLMDNVSGTIRHFTAFIFIVFTFGVLVGERAGSSGQGDVLAAAYLVPIALAVLSYFFTEIAILFFILFAIAVLII